MNFRKKYFLLTIFLILTIQILLFTKNNQKTSFRYFKWTLQEVSIGKLITISFFSGLFLSTFLNNTIVLYKKDTTEDIKENFETQDSKKDIKSNIEMPPQRDIRDTEPTISVNYRVVRNTEENNLYGEQNYSNNTNNEDDWDRDDNDW